MQRWGVAARRDAELEGEDCFSTVKAKWTSDRAGTVDVQSCTPHSRCEIRGEMSSFDASHRRLSTPPDTCIPSGSRTRTAISPSPVFRTLTSIRLSFISTAGTIRLSYEVDATYRPPHVSFTTDLNISYFAVVSGPCPLFEYTIGCAAPFHGPKKSQVSMPENPAAK